MHLAASHLRRHRGTRGAPGSLVDPNRATIGSRRPSPLLTFFQAISLQWNREERSSSVQTSGITTSLQALIRRSTASFHPAVEAAGSQSPPTPSGAPNFEVPNEESSLSGFRCTNEASTDFPAFSIRGGAYLGVGSTQNYDHLTAARSDYAFLMDASPTVARDHRGLLALVGASRNAADFLSMLGSVPLNAECEKKPVAELLDHIRNAPTIPGFRGKTEERLRGMVSPRDFDAVKAVLADGHHFFVKTWASHRAAGMPQQWLEDPERFQHLQEMQRNGRISVSAGNLTGKQTLPAIARALERWNRTHPVPLRVHVIYLSNAEQWIDSGTSATGPCLWWPGKRPAYAKFTRNIRALPLHPDGVILRTADRSHFKHNFETIPPKQVPGSYLAWSYMTLPMQRFEVAATQLGRMAKYKKLNRMVERNG